MVRPQELSLGARPNMSKHTDLDPVWNSRTLKPIRIFMNLIMPDCRMPRSMRRRSNV